MKANIRRQLAAATMAISALGFGAALAGPETSPTIACKYFVRVLQGSEKAIVVTIPDQVCGPVNQTIHFVWDKISHNHNETVLRG